MRMVALADLFSTGPRFCTLRVDGGEFSWYPVTSIGQPLSTLPILPVFILAFVRFAHTIRVVSELLTFRLVVLLFPDCADSCGFLDGDELVHRTIYSLAARRGYRCTGEREVRVQWFMPIDISYVCELWFRTRLTETNGSNHKTEHSV